MSTYEIKTQLQEALDNPSYGDWNVQTWLQSLELATTHEDSELRSLATDLIEDATEFTINQVIIPKITSLKSLLQVDEERIKEAKENGEFRDFKKRCELLGKLKSVPAWTLSFWGISGTDIMRIEIWTVIVGALELKQKGSEFPLSNDQIHSLWLEVNVDFAANIKKNSDS